MSKGRVFSRPRTKVYDTNYNIGESYYKPALDRLDRKYGGTLGDLPPRGNLSNGDAFSLRSPPPTDLPSPRTALRDIQDDFFPDAPPRTRPHSAFLGDLDPFFEGRPARRALEDDIQDDLSSSVTRLRLKASRSLASELEDVDSFSKKGMKARLDFGEKMMDSVGLTGKVRQALEEDSSASTTGRRRFLRMSSDSGDAEDLTRWTALKPGGVARRSFLEEEVQESMGVGSGAAARARKSRALLEDIESEMAAMSEKSMAREKRVRDLKALVQENEASALDNLQTTMRVKSSIQSEKKTVTF